jgi:CopG family transcriptional regulator, nickel-responsive regulator
MSSVATLTLFSFVKRAEAAEHAESKAPIVFSALSAVDAAYGRIRAAAPTPSGAGCPVKICRMGELSRIGVAIDADLLEKFDQLIGGRGYTNRSEAFRDLIRDELVEKIWESPDSHVVGTVTLVYDHHVRLLSEKLTSIQHDFPHAILSTLHVHLDHDNCLEVLVVRGKASQVRKVADTLISAKVVKHGRLTITTTGADLK